MAKSKLSKDELFINEVDESSTQKITGFDEAITLGASDQKIPTSQAVVNYFSSSALNHNTN